MSIAKVLMIQLKIATARGCKVISTDWKLLGARYLGCKAASGEFVLMLDSDQVLLEDTVERSLPTL